MKNFVLLKIYQLQPISQKNIQHKQSMARLHYCDKAFTSISKLIIHERIHTGYKPYVCKLCGNVCSKKGHLEVHERIHIGEKPYVCKLCDKEFCSTSDLRRHKKNHAGQKPYVCKLCGKACSQKGDLKFHERIHTGAKTYVCNTCRKEFSQLGHLKGHERSHSGVKPHVCKICAKSFTQSGTLKIHERIHTGEKPFVCKICTKAFSQISSLKFHERIHSGKKPFLCYDCGKAFSSRDYVMKHHRIHHEQKLEHVSHHGISKKSSCKDYHLKHLKNNDVSEKSVGRIRYKHEKKSLLAVKPFGCGVCDEIFEKETQFLSHSLHFGDHDLFKDLTFHSDYHGIVSNEKFKKGFATREMNNKLRVENNADEVRGNSLRWFCTNWNDQLIC